jgi:nucleotide-binding universal stress UspA family protein
MARIVVGVDGSEQNAEAVRWAAREARLRDAELVAVLVWDLFNQRHADGEHRFDPEYGDEQAQGALRAALEATLGAEPAAGVTPLAVCDVPAKGLLASASGAEMLVVGARGLGGFEGLLLGSVSQQVLHHAEVPVAVVRPIAGAGGEGGAGRPADAGERIVVGVDGSAPSNAALAWALAEARLRGATVDAVHAFDVPVVFGPVAGGFPLDTVEIEEAGRREVERAVDHALEALGPPPVAVRPCVVPGGAAGAIVETAEGADLVVVGRRGRGGFSRLLLGSVSENVARHAPCPVVVMPPA